MLLPLHLAALMFSAAPPTDRLGFWRGKRVIVAGASSGLGEALAAELASRGASLVIGARRVDKLSDIASLCAGKYECAKPGILELDVTATPAELEAKAAEASAMLGGVVDVFFYCAGRGQRTTALQTSATAHSELMATNFEGAVSLSRAVSLSDALGSFPFLSDLWWPVTLSSFCQQWWNVETAIFVSSPACKAFSGSQAHLESTADA